MSLEDKINIIFEYYYKYGDKNYIGESVTQNQHMIQAAMLAEKEKQSIYIILAALFHDIGHLVEFNSNDTMGSFGVQNHESIGSNFLRKNNIPEPIPSLVENHVKVKRYLTFKYKNYYNELSDASKKTLEYQGGPMILEEAIEFENDPNFEGSLKIRKYDDLAKDPDVKIIDLDYYKNILAKLLSENETI